MFKNRRCLVKILSFLQIFSLSFQQLILLPIFTEPTLVAAKNELELGDVDLSFDQPQHSFVLNVKTQEPLSYVLSYEDLTDEPT